MQRREIAGIDANRLKPKDSAVNICKDEPQHLAAYAKNRGIGPAFQMTTNADSEVGAKTIPCRWSNDESREFEYCT